LRAAIAVDFRDTDSLAKISSAPDRNRWNRRSGVSDPKTASRKQRRNASPYCSRLFGVYAGVDREAHLSAGR